PATSNVKVSSRNLIGGNVASQQVRLSNIVYVGKVAALFAVPVYGGSFLPQHLRNEDRHHTCIHGRWILVRAEDIEIAQGNCLDSVHGMKRSHVILTSQLRYRIRRNRIRRHVLAFEQRRSVTV